MRGFPPAPLSLGMKLSLLRCATGNLPSASDNMKHDPLPGLTSYPPRGVLFPPPLLQPPAPTDCAAEGNEGARAYWDEIWGLGGDSATEDCLQRQPQSLFIRQLLPLPSLLRLRDVSSPCTVYIPKGDARISISRSLSFFLNNS